MVKSRVLRIILIIVGFISLGLGCVGIALPILPTVPFFLLTSFCFVKSSVRFNKWFLNSKLYHKYLENFATNRAMILRNELILLLSVSAMLICTMIFVNKLAVTIIMCILIACKYGYFVFRVKPISKPEYLVMEKARLEAKEAAKLANSSNENTTSTSEPKKEVKPKKVKKKKVKKQKEGGGMLDKNLLKYLGNKKFFLVFIVIFNVFGLIFNLAITGFLVMSIYYFINLVWKRGLFCLLFAFIAGLFKVITVVTSNKLSGKLADDITKQLREDTYKKYLDLEGKTPFSSSEMAQLSTEGIEQLRLYYSNYLPSFFFAMIAPVLLFIIFMFLDMKVAGLYLACVPLIPISIITVSKFAKRIFAKYWDQYIGLGNSFLDNTKGLKELKIFKYDEAKQKEMDGSSEGFRKITMKVLTMQLASVTIMDLVAFGGAGLGIMLTLLDLKAGTLIPPITGFTAAHSAYVAAFMILVGAEFFLPLRALGSAFHVAMNGATAGRKIMTLLAIDTPKKGNLQLEKINSVEMKNVSFHYEDDPNNVLDNIDLKLNTGLYSLVGLSGSGKSTIAKLFSKITSPNSGEILINGKNISEYETSSFYDKVAYISATTYIFHQSIRESFKFYNPELTDQEMINLLKKVKLEHLSLDYVIQEDSTNLSGGEKQRLSLAFYLSKSYDFYIFDEITSNIDIESEEIILDIIKEISETKIVLMISHRLKSTSYSTHIYYLDNGQIVCDGDFDTLLNDDNKFKELYETQQKLEVIA